MTDTTQHPEPIPVRANESFELNALRNKILRDEPVSDEEIKLAIASIRTTRTSAAEKKTAARKAVTNISPAEAKKSLDDAFGHLS